MNVTFTTPAGALLAVLYGDRSHGERGVLIVRTVEDWYSVTDSKTGLEERPQQHGAFRPGRDYRQAGTYQVQGWFLGADRAAVRAAKRELGRIAGGDLVRMTLTDQDETTSRLVSVRHIDIPDDRGRDRFQFAIDLAAPDPRRYGPLQKVTQSYTSAVAANLISNPSFETGTAGWSALVDGGVQALTQAPGGAFAGNQHGLLTLNTSAQSVVVKRTVPLVPAPLSSAHVRVRPSTTRPLSLTLNLFAGATLLESHTLVEAVWCPAGAWTRLPLPVALPAGTTSVVFVVDSTGGLPWSAGETLAVDAAMLGDSDDYADGDSLGWKWAGTRGASVSLSMERLYLVNDGTADSEPTFLILGGMPSGFTLTEIETGRSLRYTGAIPAGATTRVDPAAGVVLVNGAPSYGLIRYQWPIVPAGQTRGYSLDAGGRPVGLTFSGEFAPAWW